MNDLVTEEDNQKRTECNDENAGETWDVVVDCVYELRADDDIGSSPANARENIENGNYLRVSSVRVEVKRVGLSVLSLTPYHPNQNLESVIWRNPKAAPNMEKKQTVALPIRLKKMMTRTESTKPTPNSGFPKAPMVKEGTTMLAASHYHSCT